MFLNCFCQLLQLIGIVPYVNTERTGDGPARTTSSTTVDRWSPVTSERKTTTSKFRLLEEGPAIRNTNITRSCFYLLCLSQFFFFLKMGTIETLFRKVVKYHVLIVIDYRNSFLKFIYEIILFYMHEIIRALTFSK